MKKLNVLMLSFLCIPQSLWAASGVSHCESVVQNQCVKKLGECVIEKIDIFYRAHGYVTLEQEMLCLFRSAPRQSYPYTQELEPIRLQSELTSDSSRAVNTCKQMQSEEIRKYGQCLP